MNLYLLRHAIAVPHGASGYEDDSMRPLTEEGRDRLRRVGSALAAMELGLDRILSSPYVRARETAEIVSEQLQIEEKLAFSEHLACGGNPEALIQDIRSLRPQAGNLMLVGHEPDLSELASLLLTGSRELPLAFKKAGLCRLAIDDLTAGRCATLEWLLPPKLMRMM